MPFGCRPPALCRLEDPASPPIARSPTAWPSARSSAAWAICDASKYRNTGPSGGIALMSVPSGSTMSIGRMRPDE